MMKDEVDSMVDDLASLTDKITHLKENVIYKLENKTQYIAQLEKKLSAAIHERDSLLDENEKLKRKLAKLDSVSRTQNDSNIAV